MKGWIFFAPVPGSFEAEFVKARKEREHGFDWDQVLISFVDVDLEDPEVLETEHRLEKDRVGSLRFNSQQQDGKIGHHGEKEPQSGGRNLVSSFGIGDCSSEDQRVVVVPFEEFDVAEVGGQTGIAAG